MARYRTAETQATGLLRYDDHHRNVKYNSGDFIWLCVPIYKPTLSEKLIYQYTELYRVLNSVSPVTYMVEPVEKPTDRRYRSNEPAHMSRLKPYISHEPT